MITETFHVRTMADLSKINLLDLRRHLDEKTTTWVYNLSRGIDHEEVRERDLPKSIGCGKNFRGIFIIYFVAIFFRFFRESKYMLLDKISTIDF